MLSLMRRGIPVSVLPVERMPMRSFPPKDIKLIIGSFDAWKPANPGYVDGIIRWVEEGGTLVFLGGTDEFDTIDGNWWSRNGYDSPSEYFLSKLMKKDIRSKQFVSKKLPGASILNVSTARRALKAANSAPAEDGAFSTVQVPSPVTAWKIDGVNVWMTTDGLPVVWSAKSGKGTIVYAGFSGETVAQSQEGENLFIAVIKAAAELTSGMEYKESGRLIMRRGPFVIARAVKGPLSIDGVFADILNPTDPLKKKIEVPEGGNIFALDVAKASTCRKGAKACIMLAGGTAFGEKEDKNIYEFRFSGPVSRNGAAWVYVPGGKAPKNVKFFVPGKNAKADSNIIADWDAETSVLKLLVPLCPDGTYVKLVF